MAARYKWTFAFCNTEDEAIRLCDRENSNRYIRKKHPARYTPWSSRDGKENKFVVWYVTK